VVRNILAKKEELEKKAEIFGALSNPKRLQILLFLSRKEVSNVENIWKELGLKQSNASQHLRILLFAGLVKRKKFWASVLYELTPLGRKFVKLIEERDD